MRVVSRFALVLAVVTLSVPLVADVYQAECPLTLVGSTPPASNFKLSPHATFRDGSQMFSLRGQTLTTYTVSDVGELQVEREDFIGTMAGRDTAGGVAFNNGFLYVSSDAGLEVFDLRDVRADGSAPLLVSRTPGLHYRRLAANGSLLAGVYPGTDLPCAPNGATCFNAIDIFDLSTPSMPTRVSSITSDGGSPRMLGFNDLAFNQGLLIATGMGGTVAYSLGNPSIPVQVSSATQPGTFLVSNGSNLVGVGNDTSVLIYSIDAFGTFVPALMETISASLAIDRGNPLMLHPQAAFDDASSRLITMVDEIDPVSLKPARTIAFDVFDFDIPQFQGSAPRIYETISYTSPDEVKWNPMVAGPYVYTVGEQSGLQTWGACGLMTGKIELEAITQLSCGGAEIHGWVTGTQKIANVELLLDGNSLGTVPVSGVPRTDVASRTPALTWRVTVNLDQTARGEHTMRLVATDAIGNRQQVASKNIFFPGPGQNCSARRRTAPIHF